MRLLLLVFCSLALATQIVAQRLPDVRGNLHTLPFGKLTQFWAHQAAGIPEGHAFIRELEQQNFNFATPQLGVLDSGFSTTSLLAGIRLTPQLHQHLSNSEIDPSDSFADVFAQAFFLDHTNHVARKLLAETYRQHGYEAQAFFYDNHDKEARDAFIAQKDKEQHETVNKFFAAIAKADTDTMLQLLPYLSKKLFLINKSFKFYDDLRALSREKQALVINFLQEHKIAKVIIYADGNISVSTIRDD